MKQSGHDTGRARSGAPARAAPWASAALLALGLVATLASPSSHEAASPRALLREAAVLWSLHPYLAAEPEVLIEVGRGLSPSERRSKLDALRDAGEADPADDEERTGLQSQLDLLTERALSDAPPLARTAWMPAHPTPTGFLGHALVQPDALAWLIAAPVLGALAVSLEFALGTRLLLAALALGCLAPPLFLGAMLPGAEQALRGSSALSATLLGVAAVRFRGSGAALPLPVWDGALQLRTVVIPLRGLVFAWAVEELFTLARSGLAEHAYQATVGGLALGAMGALLAQRYLEPAPSPRAPADPESAGAHLLDQARKARARGESDVALALLRQLVRDQPDDAELVVELWEAARECGRPDVGMPRLLALVQRCVARGELSPAARNWLRVREVDAHAQLPPESAVPLVSALLRLRERQAALDTLRGALEQPGVRLSAALALQALELARTLEDAALVERAAKAGLELPYLSPEIRERLEAAAGGSAAPPSPPSDPPAPPPPAPEAAAGAPPEPEASPAPAAAAQAPASLRRMAVLEGTPDRLGERGLSVRLVDRVHELGYERIQAIAVAAIAEPGAAEPLWILDLVLNWNAAAPEPLHVIRVRGDRFDARLLVGDALSPAEASRVFLHELRMNTRAAPLPDEAAAEARPLRLFASLADYEREVLGISR